MPHRLRTNYPNMLQEAACPGARAAAMMAELMGVWRSTAIVRIPSQAKRPDRVAAPTRDVVWSPARVTREERVAAVGQAGATLWITGLPASGKSTLSAELERRLVAAGRLAYRLDGDNLRHGLNEDVGFDAADRRENVRRTAHVAALMADAGAIVIVALVSPFASDRAMARLVHEAIGIPFIEVFLDTPLEVCERRDPKGLYARARRGEIEGFTGVSDPYEAPERPDVHLRGSDVETSLAVLSRAFEPRSRAA